MSRLLGPLSVITSKVSWRDWAWAGVKTAGAGNRLPAATAVIDLRNSRRFMAASARVRWGFGEESAKPVPAPRRAWVRRERVYRDERKTKREGGGRTG